jgi:hypothetical protein
MAIYGLNFNHSQIPTEFKRLFASRLNSKFKPVGADKGCTWLLSGVATSFADRDRMLDQATNGHRQLHVVEKMTGTKKTGIYLIFGIYVG